KDLRTSGCLLRGEEGLATIGGIDPDVRKRDAQRPEAKVELVVRFDAERRDDLPCLMRGEVFRPLRADEDAEKDREEARDGEEPAEKSRDTTHPIAPLVRPEGG